MVNTTQLRTLPVEHAAGEGLKGPNSARLRAQESHPPLGGVLGEPTHTYVHTQVTEVFYREKLNYSLGSAKKKQKVVSPLNTARYVK